MMITYTIVPPFLVDELRELGAEVLTPDEALVKGEMGELSGNVFITSSPITFIEVTEQFAVPTLAAPRKLPWQNATPYLKRKKGRP